MSAVQSSGLAVPPAAANLPNSVLTLGSRKIRLFNEDPYGSLGFGALDLGPYGYFSQNQALRKLADQIGLCQFLIATNPAARGWEPPNAYVAKLAAQMFNRAKTLLNAETILEGDAAQQRGQDTKSNWSAEAFLIHPVPFARGPMMVNQWVDEWNRICFSLQTNLMTDPSNRFGTGVTQYCYNNLMPVLNQLAAKIGVELCNIPLATVTAKDFLFDLSDTGPFTIANYHPAQLVIDQSELWDQGPVLNVPTMDQMKPFLMGIPAHVCALMLADFPPGPIPGASGMQGSPLLTRDAVIAYWSTQPDQPATAGDALTDAINKAAAKAAGQPTQQTQQSKNNGGATGAPTTVLKDVPTTGA